MDGGADPTEREALRLLLAANAQANFPVPDSLVVEAFRLGERYATEPRAHAAVAELAHAIEQAAGANA